MSLKNYQLIKLPLCSSKAIGCNDFAALGAALLNRLDQLEVKIINVAGSVAVGKTTFAKDLQRELSCLRPDLNIVNLSTDHFLYNNSELEKQNVLLKKGFPESYNKKLLSEFFESYKNKKQLPDLPIYSHNAYDHLDCEIQRFENIDILILEGVIALNPSCCDLFGVGVFLDADHSLIKQWYIDRFKRLCLNAGHDSFFAGFKVCSLQELNSRASRVWDEVNLPNLQLNIEQTKKNADVIINKGLKHSWQSLLIKDCIDIGGSNSG